MFPFEGLMAAVFVTNRVECWVEDGFYRNRVREGKEEGEGKEEEGENLEDRCVYGAGERTQSNSATFT